MLAHNSCPVISRCDGLRLFFRCIMYLYREFTLQWSTNRHPDAVRLPSDWCSFSLT